MLTIARVKSSQYLFYNSPNVSLKAVLLLLSSDLNATIHGRREYRLQKLLLYFAACSVVQSEMVTDY